MAKINLSDPNSGFNSASQLTSNNELIEDNLNNRVLYRDNPAGEANAMQNLLDMNGNRIINLPNGTEGSDPVTYSQWIAGTVPSEFTGYLTETFDVTATTQTVFNLGNAYTPGINSIRVFNNGVFLPPNAYTETDANTITLGTAATLGDEVTVIITSFDTAASTAAANITFTQTGSGATASNVNAKLQEQISVKDFGAAGDGIADDTAAIQAAEDAATAIGGSVELYFPEGTYDITDSILKKTNVHWRGPGKIKRQDNAAPTGTQWSLVFADEVDNWSIDGLSFEAVSRDIEDSVSLPRGNGDTQAPGGLNSCIDAYKCENIRISNCTMDKFTFGIHYTGSADFVFNNNYFTSNNGYTVADVLAGTDHTWDSRGGAIISTYDETITPIPPVNQRGGLIVHNRISVPGLDNGIGMMSNVYGKRNLIVSENLIEGAHAGIQCYSGSIADPGGADTYNTSSLILNNRIYAIWEQGIYIRGVLGVQVQGNYIERAAQMDADPNSSSGGIVCRVNPFEPAAAYVSAAAGDVSNDHSIIISENRVVDTGRDTVGIGIGGIYVRMDNIKISNNDIVNSDENFTSSDIPGILVANGGELKNCTVVDNKVSGYFSKGISVTDTNKNANLKEDYLSLKNNKIELISADIGIAVSWYSFNTDISGNIIRGANKAVTVRLAPNTRIYNNRIADASEGIQIGDGCDAGSQAYFETKGVSTKAIRRGGAVDVIGNEYQNVTTPHAIINTAVGDTTFYGRTREFRDEIIDGEKFYLDFASNTVTTSDSLRTWNLHDTARNASVAGSVSPGVVCVTPGTHGVATTTTGDTANTSAVISNVADFDGYGVGIYLNPSAGFSAPVRIIAIDVDAGTITVDTAATSTNIGVTLSLQAPVFKAMAALSA